MTETRRQMHLSVLALGAGNNIFGWRLKDSQAGSLNLGLLTHIIKTAERGKFDFFFLADALNTGANVHPSWTVRYEPLTLLSYLAGQTSHIGLAATVSTTYTQPYNAARYFASLDFLSGGRADWNVVGGAFPEAAANFGNVPHPPHPRRYAIAREFIEVMKGLWDSWEADALVMDKESGLYIDPEKMHVLGHEGEHFSVKGPLNILRPPQGYPVIVQAGASEEGRALAGDTADVIFSVVSTFEESKAFRDDLRARAAKAGRNPDLLKVVPGIFVMLGESEDDARARLAELGTMIKPEVGMQVLSNFFGHDMSVFDLDGPVPDLPPTEMMQGYSVILSDMARAKGLTLR